MSYYRHRHIHRHTQTYTDTCCPTSQVAKLNQQFHMVGDGPGINSIGPPSTAGNAVTTTWDVGVVVVSV